MTENLKIKAVIDLIYFAGCIKALVAEQNFTKSENGKNTI